MKNFEAGQKVKCIDPEMFYLFPPDEVLVVKSMYKDGDFVNINSLDGRECGAYYTERFEAV